MCVFSCGAECSGYMPDVELSVCVCACVSYHSIEILAGCVCVCVWVQRADQRCVLTPPLMQAVLGNVPEVSSAQPLSPGGQLSSLSLSLSLCLLFTHSLPPSPPSFLPSLSRPLSFSLSFPPSPSSLSLSLSTSLSVCQSLSLSLH